MITRKTVTAAAVSACFSLAVVISGTTGVAAAESMAKDGMTKNEMASTGMAKIGMIKQETAKEASVKEDMTKDGMYKIGKSDDMTAKDVVPDGMK